MVLNKNNNNISSYDSKLAFSCKNSVKDQLSRTFYIKRELVIINTTSDNL